MESSQATLKVKKQPPIEWEGEDQHSTLFSLEYVWLYIFINTCGNLKINAQSHVDCRMSDGKGRYRENRAGWERGTSL